VSLLALKAREYEVVEFHIPSGQEVRVHYTVDASDPVSVFLLNSENLSRFEKDEPCEYYGKRRKRSHDEDVPVSNAGKLNLVIWNETSDIAAVDYEIEILKPEARRTGFMPARKVIHVVPDGRGNWAVKSEDAHRSAGVYANKNDAVERARDIASNASTGQIIVHARDGKIQSQHTYGTDPYPPKG
jgi:hypothetical protein